MKLNLYSDASQISSPDNAHNTNIKSEQGFQGLQRKPAHFSNNKKKPKHKKTQKVCHHEEIDLSVVMFISFFGYPLTFLSRC